MLRTIHLHGRMAELFGERFELEVHNVAEVFRALGSQIKGFRTYVGQRHFKITLRHNRKGRAFGEDELTSVLGNERGEIHVYPVAYGAKENNGLMKIIAGVLIAAVAFWAAPAAGGLGAAIGGGMMGGVTYGQVAMLGLGLAMTGLSQLLSKKPEGEKEEDSLMLSGAVNVSEQGGPVPLIYGRCRVGSTMISSGITTADIPITEKGGGNSGGK